MMRETVRWSDEADEVISGDLTAAAAYITPAGGAVVIAVAPCGLGQRDRAMVGFTTSLGFSRKLERIIRDPHVALAYHTREHGFSASHRYVLAQGQAVVGMTPSRERLEELISQGERYAGEVKRVLTWPDLGCYGDPRVAGAPWPAPPRPQQPPKNGSGPRVDVARAAGRIAMLPHRVLAYRGGDGFPVVVPVELGGHDNTGLRLVAATGLLPPGGRRAGLLAHAYRPQFVGLSTRTFTGWLEVTPDGTATYAPHTSRGFVAPPRKNLLLISNGLFAKLGMWQAQRRGVAGRLQQLAVENAGPED